MSGIFRVHFLFRASEGKPLEVFVWPPGSTGAKLSSCPLGQQGKSRFPRGRYGWPGTPLGPREKK